MNNDIGTSITLGASLGGTLLGAGSIAIMFAKNMGVAVTTITALQSAILPIAGIVAAVVAVGMLLYKVIDANTGSVEKWQERIDATNQSLQTNKDRLEEINKLPWNEKTTEINRERVALEKENAELEKQLEIQKKKQLAQASSELAGFGITRREVASYEATWGDSSFVSYESAGAALQGLADRFEETTEFILENGASVQTVFQEINQKGTEAYATLVAEANNYATILGREGQLTDEQRSGYNDLVIEMSDVVDNLLVMEAAHKDGIDGSRELTYQERALIATYNTLSSVEKQATNTTRAMNGEFESVLKESGMTRTSLFNLTKQVQIFNNTKLGTSDKISQLLKLASAAGMTSTLMSSLTGASNSDIVRTIAGYRAQGLTEEQAFTKVFGLFVPSFPESEAPPEDGVEEDTAGTLTDKALTAFNSYYKDLQHLRNMNEISEEEYYSRLQVLINNYTVDATKNMKAYGTDSKTIAQNMYSYEEELVKHSTEVAKAAEEAKTVALEKEIDARKKALESLQSAYESLFGVVSNNIQDEIDALEKEKDSISDFYQKQIDALNDTNSALEEQIALEEALDALAKAKSTKVMVYKDGRFQYVSDVDATSEARSNLESIQRKQQLESDTKALEDERDAQLASIGKAIKGWEEYKDAWSSVVSDYENKQNLLLIQQQLGIQLEGDNWKTRLDNLKGYIADYNSTMSRLNALNSISNDDGSYKDSIIAQMKANSAQWGGANSTQRQNLADANSELGASLGWTRDDTTGIWHDEFGKRAYASGTTSAYGGVSLVGEKGAEMRVLGKGDGIIPADVTKNLWSWGMTTPSSMLSALSGVGSSVSNAMQISIGNISLPSVSNASQFVEELKGFKRYAIQYGTGI